MSDFEEISSGDIPSQQAVTAWNQGVVQDMSDPGWVCRSQVLRSNGWPLFDFRTITSLISVSGKMQFQCSLSSDEAALLLSGDEVIRYTWVVEVENLTIPYRRESRFELLVTTPGVA